MRDGASRVSEFLSSAGWEGAVRTAMAGDASRRRYERLSRRGETAVLMIAPPETGEDTRSFERVASLLVARGMSAPRIFAADHRSGLLLLEDFGDDLFARRIERMPREEERLYEAAVDLLVELHRHPPPVWMDRYDLPRLADRMALAWIWYRDTGSNAAPHEAVNVVSERLGTIPGLCKTVALRDYHSENLVWLGDRVGVRCVGLLDFQDALAGHPAYDLVSLLEDARRDVSPDLARRMRERYVSATGSDAEAFELATALFGVQRSLRILGVFARLKLRDGKVGYLQLIPRVWGHLYQALQHPALAEVRRAVLADLPPPSEDHLRRLRTA